MEEFKKVDRKLAEDLKSLRKGSGVSITSVSKALKISEQAIYRYEQGKRKIGLEHIPILSKIFCCSIEEVVNAALNSCRNDR